MSSALTGRLHGILLWITWMWGIEVTKQWIHCHWCCRTGNVRARPWRNRSVRQNPCVCHVSLVCWRQSLQSNTHRLRLRTSLVRFHLVHQSSRWNPHLRSIDQVRRINVGHVHANWRIRIDGCPVAIKMVKHLEGFECHVVSFDEFSGRTCKHIGVVFKDGTGKILCGL